MAIGIAELPGDIYFCDGADELQKTGCDLPSPAGSLLLAWTKPEDTGAGIFEQIPIIQYELELAYNPNFLVSKKFNFTLSEIGGLYASKNVAQVLILDLSKGTFHYARVRARNWVGVGTWSSKPTVQVVISEPSPPRMKFLGSGGDTRAFLRVFLDPPTDFGDGNFTHRTQNTTVRLISYNFSISPTITFGAPSYHAVGTNSQKSVRS